MKNISMMIAFTALLTQVNADVVVDLQSISSSASQGATFSGLDGTVVSDNATVLVSGSFTASDMGSGESYSATFTGVSNWNYSAVSADGNVSALGGLAAENIDGNNGGWGVVGGADARDLDRTIEALFVTFDLSGLSSEHQSNFRLTGLDIGRFGDGEAYNYMILDSDGDVVTSASGQINDAPILNIALNDGDALVIGHESGGYRFNGFSVDVIPEPATLGLVMMTATGLLVIRRRFML